MTNELSPDELAARWAMRLQASQFSEGVAGVGEVRIMGKSGDAAVAYPRLNPGVDIATLAADEQWAVGIAEQIIAEAVGKSRMVVSVPTGGSPTDAERVTGFSVTTEQT